MRREMSPVATTVVESDITSNRTISKATSDQQALDGSDDPAPEQVSSSLPAGSLDDLWNQEMAVATSPKTGSSRLHPSAVGRQSSDIPGRQSGRRSTDATSRGSGGSSQKRTRESVKGRGIATLSGRPSGEVAASGNTSAPMNEISGFDSPSHRASEFASTAEGTYELLDLALAAAEAAGSDEDE